MEIIASNTYIFDGMKADNLRAAVGIRPKGKGGYALNIVEQGFFSMNIDTHTLEKRINRAGFSLSPMQRMFLANRKRDREGRKEERKAG